jgi:hypothetical protein
MRDTIRISFPLIIKVLFDETGKIFGAQAAGLDGVEKRMDVIASVIRLNGKISGLLDSELCYAPPYSSAKDPVNIAGMAAENILKGFVKPVFYEDLKDAYIIDVRPKMSFELKSIPNAVNIPAQELRARNSEVSDRQESCSLLRKRFYKLYSGKDFSRQRV